MKKRIELHSHTLLSDGQLTASELVRRAIQKKHAAIAITDHADAANIDFILNSLNNFIKYSRDHFGIPVICGIELTHTPPQDINELSKYAKQNGAELVIVHGETPVEPVAEQTNRFALESEYVNILAHPGFITKEELKVAKKNNKYIEITSRKGHNWTNGHIVKMAKDINCKFLVNTDTHSPSDLIDYETSVMVAKGAGLSLEQAEHATHTNPIELLKSLGINL